MKKLKSPGELAALQEEIRKGRDPKKPCITICAGTGCLAYGTQKIIECFRREIDKQGLQDRVQLRTSGCHGFCERGPMVVIHPQKIFYQRIKAEDVPEIITKTVLAGEVIDRLSYVDPATKQKIVYEHEVPFYKRQTRYVLGMNGEIDPAEIDDYLAIGGYGALAKALSTMKPEAVVQEVIKANLRGRGGGGSPLR